MGAGCKQLNTTLHELVEKFQIHTCSDKHCLKKTGDCDRHFPFAHSSTCEIDDATGKYIYPRNNEWVTPYTPKLLMMWGANCNVLRITGENWIGYLCKYMTKQDSVGKVKIEPKNSILFGIGDVADYDDAAADLLSVLLNMKCCSVNEAAWLNAGYSIVGHSFDVEFLDTEVPLTRKNHV